ncbi:MAG: hypothetical protein JSW31_05430, partial [Burkholderiales bacterium]
VTVKVKTLPLVALTLAERKSAWPDELVRTEPVPLSAPLHVPLTVAPETGLPLLSRTTTEAAASVLPQLLRRLMAMSATDILVAVPDAPAAIVTD